MPHEHARARTHAINVVCDEIKFSYSHKSIIPFYLDFDLDRERDLDREWWEPSLECAGERLVVLTEP